jgi:hypothetical protein
MGWEKEKRNTKKAPANMRRANIDFLKKSIPSIYQVEIVATIRLILG